jgi:hypothetical protein
MAEIMVALELFEGVPGASKSELTSAFQSADTALNQARHSDGKEAVALYKTALAGFLHCATKYDSLNKGGSIIKAAILGTVVGGVSTATISMAIKHVGKKEGTGGQRRAALKDIHQSRKALLADAKSTHKEAVPEGSAQKVKDDAKAAYKKDKKLVKTQAAKDMGAQLHSTAKSDKWYKNTYAQAGAGAAVGGGAAVGLSFAQISATVKIIAKKIEICVSGLRNLGEEKAIAEVHAAAERAKSTLSSYANESVTYTSGLEAAMAEGLTGLQAKIYAKAYEEVEEALDSNEPTEDEDDAIEEDIDDAIESLLTR